MLKLMKLPLGMSAALLWAMNVSATPILTVSNILIGTGTGSFKVHLSNPGGTNQISGYTVSFAVSPEAGSQGSLPITSVSTPANPLYPGQVAALGTGSPNYYTINDIDNTAPFYIVGGNNTDLVQVNFSIPNGTTGNFDVTLLTANAGNVPHSELDLPSGSPITTAQFSTTPAVVVTPEPATVSLVALGSLLFFCNRRRRGALKSN